MDSPSLKSLAEVADQAGKAGATAERPPSGASAEGGASRKPARRKRTLRLTAIQPEGDSPQVSGDDASDKSGSGDAWQAPAPRPGVPICQVEDCGRDLGGLTTYHQRCRICEVHIKLPSFVRHGTMQRFCQQCGRCHQLAAFDSGKRSCRAQLVKHNARRRKLASKKAAQASSADDSPRTGRPGDRTLPDTDGGDSSPHAKRPARRPTAKGGDTMASTATLSAGGGGNGHRLAALGLQKPAPPAGGLAQSQTDFLRSFAPAYAHDLAAAVSKPAVGGGGAPSAQDFQTAYGFGAEAYGRPDWLTGRLPGGSHNSAFTTESLSKAYSNAPQFGRLAEDVMQQHPLRSGLEQQQQQQQQQQSQALQAVDPAAAAAAVWASRPGFRAYDGVPGMPEAGGPSASYDRAMSLLAQQGAAAAGGAGPGADYFPQNFLLRLSVKLFDCTPAQLPADLRDQLTGWLQAAPTGVEGYMRPGCVHVTLQTMMDAAAMATDDGAHNLRDAVKHLLERDPGTWASRLLIVQLLGEVAVVKAGQIAHHWTVARLAAAAGDGVDGGPTLPRILRIDPTAIAGAASQVLIVLGYNITGEGCTLLARANGRDIDAEVLPTDPEMAAAAAVAGVEVVRLRLPEGVAAGLLHVEVQRGVFMGEAYPVAVLAGAAARAEVASVVEALPAEQRHGFLADVGIVAAAATEGGGAPDPACLSIHAALATARRLLAYACKRGLWALSAFLLPVAARGVEGVPGLLSSCAAFADGWSLLHLAVASGSLRMVEVLLEWGQQQQHAWDGTAGGPGGLTSLHLAALLPDAGSVALLLARHTAPGPAAWFSLETQDGQKPVHFASRADGGGGGTGLNAAMMRAIAHIASGGAPPPIRTGAFAGPGAAHPSPQSTASGSASDTSTRNRSRGKLLGGAAWHTSDSRPPSLAAIAAAVSALSTPSAVPAAATTSPAGKPGHARPCGCGCRASAAGADFFLSEPADSPAYTSHAAPPDVSLLWAPAAPQRRRQGSGGGRRAAAAAAAYAVATPPAAFHDAAQDVAPAAVQLIPAPWPSPLAEADAAAPTGKAEDGDCSLAAQARVLISCALSAQNFVPQKKQQDGERTARCRQDAAWQLLASGGASLRPLLSLASLGALCVAFLEALPLVL